MSKRNQGHASRVAVRRPGTILSPSRDHGWRRLSQPAVNGRRRTKSPFADGGADALSRQGFNLLRPTLAAGKLAQALDHRHGHNGDLSAPPTRGCTDYAHFV